VKSPFDVAKRYLETPDQRGADLVPDVSEGRIIAVKICSHVLDACTWFSFDPDFKPNDDEQLVVFYDDELAFLRNKTVEQLKKIHQWKLTFGSGARVRQ
jgi:hypothetical protein